jgi:photosystem II stability/assembly factor-like uncharacterized protein
MCTPEELWDVCFPVSEQIGYAVGNNHIYKTTNGGSSWVEVLTGYGSLLSVCFPEGAEVGYVVGQVGTILKTTNGGANWLEQEPPGGYGGNLHSVHFPTNNQSGFTAGSCYNGQYNIFKTTNGGSSWLDASTGTTDDINGLYVAPNCQIAYAVGDGGAILKTTDAGVSWTAQNSGVFSDLRDVCFPTTAQVGYVVGSYGVVLKTTNGGSTWDKQRQEDDVLRGVSFPTGDAVGYAVGGDHDSALVVKTTDGGGLWITEAGHGASTSRLLQVSPNPSRGPTTIRYAIGGNAAGQTAIHIYSQTGRLVRSFGHLNPSPCAGSLIWDGRDEYRRELPSGAYAVRMSLAGATSTRIVSLVRR